MSDPIKIDFDFDGEKGAKIARLFKRLENPEPALRDFGEYKRRQIILAMPRMPRSQRSEPGLPPAKRSGLFSQRITYNVEGPRLEVGTNDVRARLLQQGGTIHPKTAKALAVPIHPDAQGKRPRDFNNLTFIPRPGKAPLLVRIISTERRTTMADAQGHERISAKGKAYYTRTVQKKFDVMFILLKSVTIKARPYLFWTERDSNYLLTALNRQFRSESA